MMIPDSCRYFLKKLSPGRFENVSILRTEISCLLETNFSKMIWHTINLYFITHNSEAVRFSKLKLMKKFIYPGFQRKCIH